MTRHAWRYAWSLRNCCLALSFSCCLLKSLQASSQLLHRFQLAIALTLLPVDRRYPSGLAGLPMHPMPSRQCLHRFAASSMNTLCIYQICPITNLHKTTHTCSSRTKHSLICCSAKATCLPSDSFILVANHSTLMRHFKAPSSSCVIATSATKISCSHQTHHHRL